MSLTQKEADRLLRLEKRPSDAHVYKFPASGGKCQVPLISGLNKNKEIFTLDVYRGRTNIIKIKYQTRARKIVPLARLDFGGSPHRNPNGEEITTHHLHIYREGYGAKWAYPLSPPDFSINATSQQLLTEFLQFCNIVNFSFSQGTLDHL